MQRLFGGIGLDVRLGLRRLAASRSSTTVAIAMLSLAIGVGAAVFSVADAVALRDLPFGDPGGIMAVLEFGPGPVDAQGGRTTTQTYLDWRGRQTAFEALACTRSARLDIANEGREPDVLRALRVSSEFFSVLRASPLLGRPLRAGDERLGRRIVILGYDFWQRRFGGARDVVGRTMPIYGRPWEIVGVMPKGFSYPLGAEHRTEVYVPLVLEGPEWGERPIVNGRLFRVIDFDVIGRLRPGVSPAQATERMNAVAATIDAEHPTWRPGARVRVAPLREHLLGNMRSWMLMLVGAVGLVLAIACANVGNLRIAEAVAHDRDLAICAAIGASRWRTTRAFLVESLILTAAGAGLGITVAWGGIGVLRAWLPQDLPRIADPSLDLRVLGAAFVATFATGLLAGLAPGLVRLRGRLHSVTNGGSPSATPGTAARRVSNALVVGEVALAVVVCAGAGLFVASFTRLMQVELGFDHRGVLSLPITVPMRKSRGPSDDAFAGARPMIEQVREAVRAVPGVVGAEVTDGGTPLAGVEPEPERVSLPPRGELGSEEDIADIRVVTPGHLALLRVPLLRGRHISTADRAETTPVVVINEAAARRYWPGQDPIGQRVSVRGAEREVVGMVGNVREGPEALVRPAFYLPFAQSPWSRLTLAVRTAGDPLTALPAVKKAIRSVLPGHPFMDSTVTLEAFFDRLTARRRFSAALLSLFGVFGVVIAAAGVFGVLSHRVAQRTHEFGVRTALGATSGRVVCMVLGQAIALLGAGLAIGLWTAWQFGAGVKAFLFRTEPADPIALTAAALTLITAGLAAALVPACRAARVDPVETLRHL